MKHEMPMFFEGLHKPVSWKEASKRKEIYEWAKYYFDKDATDTDDK